MDEHYVNPPDHPRPIAIGYLSSRALAPSPSPFDLPVCP